MSSLMLDPLPEGMFAPDEEAIIVFARKSALMQPIDDGTYEQTGDVKYLNRAKER